MFVLLHNGIFNLQRPGYHYLLFWHYPMIPGQQGSGSQNFVEKFIFRFSLKTRYHNPSMKSSGCHEAIEPKTVA